METENLPALNVSEYKLPDDFVEDFSEFGIEKYLNDSENEDDVASSLETDDIFFQISRWYYLAGLGALNQTFCNFALGQLGKIKALIKNDGSERSCSYAILATEINQFLINYELIKEDVYCQKHIFGEETKRKVSKTIKKDAWGKAFEETFKMGERNQERFQEALGCYYSQKDSKKVCADAWKKTIIEEFIFLDFGIIPDVHDLVNDRELRKEIIKLIGVLEENTESGKYLSKLLNSKFEALDPSDEFPNAYEISQLMAIRENIKKNITTIKSDERVEKLCEKIENYYERACYFETRRETYYVVCDVLTKNPLVSFKSLEDVKAFFQQQPKDYETYTGKVRIREYDILKVKSLIEIKRNQKTDDIDQKKFWGQSCIKKKYVSCYLKKNAEEISYKKIKTKDKLPALSKEAMKQIENVIERDDLWFSVAKEKQKSQENENEKFLIHDEKLTKQIDIRIKKLALQISQCTAKEADKKKKKEKEKAFLAELLDKNISLPISFYARAEEIFKFIEKKKEADPSLLTNASKKTLMLLKEIKDFYTQKPAEFTDQSRDDKAAFSHFEIKDYFEGYASASILSKSDLLTQRMEMQVGQWYYLAGLGLVDEAFLAFAENQAQLYYGKALSQSNNGKDKVSLGRKNCYRKVVGQIHNFIEFCKKPNKEESFPVEDDRNNYIAFLKGQENKFLFRQKQAQYFSGNFWGQKRQEKEIEEEKPASSLNFLEIKDYFETGRIDPDVIKKAPQKRTKKEKAALEKATEKMLDQINDWYLLLGAGLLNKGDGSDKSKVAPMSIPNSGNISIMLEEQAGYYRAKLQGARNKRNQIGQEAEETFTVKDKETIQSCNYQEEVYSSVLVLINTFKEFLCSQTKDIAINNLGLCLAGTKLQSTPLEEKIKEKNKHAFKSGRKHGSEDEQNLIFSAVSARRHHDLLPLQPSQTLTEEGRRALAFKTQFMLPPLENDYRTMVGANDLIDQPFLRKKIVTLIKRLEKEVKTEGNNSLKEGKIAALNTLLDAKYENNVAAGADLASTRFEQVKTFLNTHFASYKPAFFTHSRTWDLVTSIKDYYKEACDFEVYQPTYYVVRDAFSQQPLAAFTKWSDAVAFIKSQEASLEDSLSYPKKRTHKYDIVALEPFVQVKRNAPASADSLTVSQQPLNLKELLFCGQSTVKMLWKSAFYVAGKEEFCFEGKLNKEEVPTFSDEAIKAMEDVILRDAWFFETQKDQDHYLINDPKLRKKIEIKIKALAQQIDPDKNNADKNTEVVQGILSDLFNVLSGEDSFEALSCFQRAQMVFSLIDRIEAGKNYLALSGNSLHEMEELLKEIKAVYAKKASETTEKKTFYWLRRRKSTGSHNFGGAYNDSTVSEKGLFFASAQKAYQYIRNDKNCSLSIDGNPSTPFALQKITAYFSKDQSGELEDVQWSEGDEDSVRIIYSLKDHSHNNNNQYEVYEKRIGPKEPALYINEKYLSDAKAGIQAFIDAPENRREEAYFSEKENNFNKTKLFSDHGYAAPSINTEINNRIARLKERIKFKTSSLLETKKRALKALQAFEVPASFTLQEALKRFEDFKENLKFESREIFSGVFSHHTENLFKEAKNRIKYVLSGYEVETFYMTGEEESAEELLLDSKNIYEANKINNWINNIEDYTRLIPVTVLSKKMPNGQKSIETLTFGKIVYKEEIELIREAFVPQMPVEEVKSLLMSRGDFHFLNESQLFLIENEDIRKNLRKKIDQALKNKEIIYFEAEFLKELLKARVEEDNENARSEKFNEMKRELCSQYPAINFNTSFSKKAKKMLGEMHFDATAFTFPPTSAPHPFIHPRGKFYEKAKKLINTLKTEVTKLPDDAPAAQAKKLEQIVMLESLTAFQYSNNNLYEAQNFLKDIRESHKDIFKSVFSSRARRLFEEVESQLNKQVQKQAAASHVSTDKLYTFFAKTSKKVQEEKDKDEVKREDLLLL